MLIVLQQRRSPSAVQLLTSFNWRPTICYSQLTYCLVSCALQLNRLQPCSTVQATRFCLHFVTACNKRNNSKNNVLSRAQQLETAFSPSLWSFHSTNWRQETCWCCCFRNTVLATARRTVIKAHCNSTGLARWRTVGWRHGYRGVNVCWPS